MMIRMVEIDNDRLERITQIFARADVDEVGEPFNFYSVKLPNGEQLVLDDVYPPLADTFKERSQTFHYFAAVILQNFGFWHSDHEGYVEPLYGTLDGKQKKGSDLLWEVSTRKFLEDPNFFNPSRLTQLTWNDFREWLSDDNGIIPFPDLQVRYTLTRHYAQSMLRLHRMALQLATANCAKDKTRFFVNSISNAWGYHEDPFKKKAWLLTMALANRPEQFIQPSPHNTFDPIVDYHVMRLLLRMGVIRCDEITETVLESRRRVTGRLEQEIRQCAFEAVNRIVEESGKPLPLVDKMLWLGRRFCPEMEEPNCPDCIFRDACAQRTELFQPVHRTTYY